MATNKSGLVFIISGIEIQADRPEPIVSEIEVVKFNRRMDPKNAVNDLVAGNFVLVTDLYSSGLDVLNALKAYINQSNQSFKGQQDSRALFRDLSHRLLLFVSNNKLTVKKAPEIGWLKILYPEMHEFLLPFPQVQGLNSSWQWYQKGVAIPGLDNKIHPYFGTYFPTRFEHLKLFSNWLRQYRGEKKSAIDVGIGCGVLSYQLLNQRFEKVYGTDSNPNVIIGLNEHNRDSKLELFFGDLFAGCEEKTELIVFNPPWIAASHDGAGIDNAIYYDDTLFPRFFEEAKNHLKPDGRVVLLFSNLAQITDGESVHPIEKELSEGGRFQKELFQQMNVGEASDKTRRNQTWRGAEMVELWVLKAVIG